MKRKKNGNGHDVLVKLAASVDARFAGIDGRFEKIERDLGRLGKDFRGMRKDFKKLFAYVAYIDEESQKHAKDKSLHAGRS